MSNRQYSFLLFATCALLVLGAFALAFFVWLWRRLHPRVPASEIPRFPIVLVHGIFGFDRIGYGPLAVSYFRGAANAMRKAGARVYSPRLPALGSVPERAKALAEFIRALPDAKVSIVAHSMGGLDARYAVAKLDIAPRVACVVTVATPHRGSPVADLAARKALSLVRKIASRFGAHTHAVDWLTSEAAERLNLDAPDHPNVVYGSVVCRAGSRLWRQNPILYAPWLMMRRAHGESDGLVPAESQRWGTVWMEVEHDHWGQLGWSLSGDANLLYVRIVKELAARGA